MNCRRFLATVAAVTPIGIAGCSYGAQDPPFSVSAPTVRQGESGTIAITAPNVASMHFDEQPGGSPPKVNFESIDIEYISVQFTPSPDAVWQGDPPSWNWNPAQSVMGDVPVRVNDDAPPGDYQFAVSIMSGDTEDRRMRQSTITVTEGSGT